MTETTNEAQAMASTAKAALAAAISLLTDTETALVSIKQDFPPCAPGVTIAGVEEIEAARGSLEAHTRQLKLQLDKFGPSA